MDAKNERGLFEIRAIAIENDEVIYKADVIAEGESDALFQSDLKEALKSKKMTRDDVNILIREFGPLPKKERAKTVRVIGQVGNLVLAKE